MRRPWLRTQGQVESQRAFDAAETAYLAREAPTTVLQRLTLGGGDPDIAAMRVQAQDAVHGLSDTSRVGLTAAEADAQYWKAVVPMWASTGDCAWSVWTDFVPMDGYNEWRNRWPTKVKGDL